MKIKWHNVSILSFALWGLLIGCCAHHECYEWDIRSTDSFEEVGGIDASAFLEVGSAGEIGLSRSTCNEHSPFPDDEWECACDHAGPDIRPFADMTGDGDLGYGTISVHDFGMWCNEHLTALECHE